ncbi:MAG TPA: hypothetical protein VN613_06325 [Gemmatimonadaceae bacterium]|nr:hypothetical protein [Gemmatimonadaceae bacterium]
MFAQVLYTQWKWARTELVLYVLAAFLIPTIIIRTGFSYVITYDIHSALGVSTLAGVCLAALAMLCAFGLAWRPYILDAGLKHVGPLSLPVSWGAFVRMRFLAGATLLLIPAAAVWFGGVLAAASVTIPPTLHAYPGGLAIRFYLASLVAYAAAFALQYVAGKHAVRVAVIVLVVVAVAEIAAQMIGFSSIVAGAWNMLTNWPGPFAVFAARWMLIDV